MTMIMTSKLRLCRLIIATILFPVLLVPALALDAFAQEAKKVRIGYSALSLSFLPHLFARDAGVFQKHGLTVELIQMAGPIQVAALAAGEIDFGAAVSPALFAAVRGLPLRGVMIAVKTPLFYIVAEPGIKRIQDLVGKKVAVDTIGALQYIAAKAMFKKKGVNPEQISYIQTGSVSNSMAALGSGAVNGALLSIPNNIIMTQKGFNQMVSTPEAGVNFPPSGLSVHASKLQKDPAQIKRVLQAMLDAVALSADGAAVTSYIQRQWKLNARLAEESQRQMRPTLVTTGKMSLEEVQEFLDAAYENGQIQQKASAKNLMDYGPLDEVLRERRGK
jgi:NitT/TauT family transport system substrate-binding protein